MVERWQHTQVIHRADVCVNGNSTVGHYLSISSQLAVVKLLPRRKVT